MVESNLNLKKPQIKRLTSLVVVAGIGIMLMVLAGFMGGGDPTNENPVPSSPEVENNATSATNEDQINLEEQALEEDIAQLLQQITGVGEVTVKVRLKGTNTQTYAVNTSVNKKNIEESDTDGGTRKTTETVESKDVVMVNGQRTEGESPVLVETVRSGLQGVVVVAEGASDEDVRVMLTRTVQTLLDLPANRVTVLPKKGR